MKKTRNTKAKQVILDLITDSNSALTANEIQHSELVACDRVTTYRILDRLQEEGLIHRVVTHDSIVRFARCRTCVDETHHHQHVHFNCQSCQAVLCLENTSPTIQLPAQFTLTEVHITVSGICDRCNA
ncbi:MAG TPA: transcriptional repressor [Luteibaculaceae bacterium]|nr:transcriptional repressor [Luteibaculaceae bacterium]